jgi:L-alanine-DL-glutamate epimerase-like enolase superfamily enzyme
MLGLVERLLDVEVQLPQQAPDAALSRAELGARTIPVGPGERPVVRGETLADGPDMSAAVRNRVLDDVQLALEQGTTPVLCTTCAAEAEEALVEPLEEPEP